MKRVFIVHGWGATPESGWIPSLKNELEKKGYEVHVPSMPQTDTPKVDLWTKKLATVVEEPNHETYFIGHSIGCQAILRYLQTLDAPVGGAIFVAGWFNLENLETTEEKEIAEPWITTPIEIEKIKRVLPNSVLIISDNDPFGAFEENKTKFAEFTSHIVVLPNAGHIEQKVEPSILGQFENISE